MKNALRLPAFAKVNLRLQVHGRRPDGYHELRTIFQTISLHDTLTISLTRKSGITLETNDAALPTDSGNLVFRAIDAIARETNYRGGVHVLLDKRIPVARGLGGGSSDAATALIGMLRLTKQKKFPLARLMEIGASLGADVPFFLFGGRALAVNRGDEIYPLPDTPKRAVLVVSPREIGVSTKEAYQWISERNSRGISEELTNRPKPNNIWEFCALCWGRPGEISNDFEVPVFRRYPRLREIRDALLKRGAAEAALAGSGSAVFGVFRNPAWARRAARKFPEDSIFLAETVSREKYGRTLGWSVAG